MADITIMQGDQYSLMFTGTVDGAAMDMSQIEKIEFFVNDLRKCWPDEVKQDMNGNFLFPLTQRETLKFGAKPQRVQVRVKFKGAETPIVVGVGAGEVAVQASRSKVVL